MGRILQCITAAVCGICGFLWGQLDGLLYALIVFMVLDYLTGLISTWIHKDLSSVVGFISIAKKVLILILVAVGHLLDDYVLGGGSVCRSAVIGFYLANEGISILENAGNIGLPLPKKLTDVLEQLKNKEE
ncbi:MAG: phage holin family protein [Ruminococcus sp.]|nr:phage holin family protein [Ruminococcus sp.]